MDADQIRSLQPVMAAFAEQFRDCFKREATYGHFQRYLLGLQTDLDRKSIEPIALAAGVPVRTLQEFLQFFKWDHHRVKDGHYHHVYTSGVSSVFDPGPYDLVFEGNHFQDSRGDYLRLRNQVGHTEVINNTFISTAMNTNRAFLAMPVFNNFDVGREYLSTEIVVDGNHFQFNSNYLNWFDNGMAISFHASGEDPPGVRYLLTPGEAQLLESGTLEEQFHILEEVIGLNLDTIDIGENTFLTQTDRNEKKCSRNCL